VGVGVARAVVAVLFVLPLGACAGVGGSTQSAGHWNIERRIDRISGTPTARVYVRKMVLNRRGELDWETFQIGCFNGRPIARVAFHARVGTNRNAIFEYRFDANPGHKPYAEILTDHRTVVIEEKGELARFLGELATANVLLVRVSSLTGPPTEVVFQVAGAPAAIEAAYAACPVERSTAAR
jgi:hypothetical protein